MNAVRGAAGALLFVSGFYFCPPNKDPQFMALSWKIQFLAILGLMLLLVGGVLIFAWGALSSNSDSKRSESPEDPRG